MPNVNKIAKNQEKKGKCFLFYYEQYEHYI